MRVSVICKWGQLRSLAEVEHCCNYFLMFQCYWITIVLPGPLFQIIDPSWTINTQIQVETDIMVSLLLVRFVALRVACIAVGRKSTNAERPAAAFNTGLAPNASLTNGNALFCAPVLTHGVLSLEACLAANRQMGFRSTAAKIWGDQGEGEFDVVLPQRFIPRTCPIPRHGLILPGQSQR